MERSEHDNRKLSLIQDAKLEIHVTCFEASMDFKFGK